MSKWHVSNFIHLNSHFIHRGRQDVIFLFFSELFDMGDYELNFNDQKHGKVTQPYCRWHSMPECHVSNVIHLGSLWIYSGLRMWFFGICHSWLIWECMNLTLMMKNMGKHNHMTDDTQCQNGIRAVSST